MHEDYDQDHMIEARQEADDDLMFENLDDAAYEDLEAYIEWLGWEEAA